MTDPERSRLRALVRQHHPDRGGDPEVFRTVLAAYRAASGGGAAGAAPVVFHRRPRGLRRLLRRRHPAGRLLR